MVSASTQTVRVPERQPEPAETRSVPRPAPEPKTKPFTIKVQTPVPY